ncbi:hypothetical protein VSX64_10605 [Aurantimonas sp. C2-6-R+9]|uniref:PilZ domain-containing protein n=2 Tax=root TaxID=1 RepID=A0A9C9TFB6_9HYPH|nr:MULTISPECIES: hypothetical protein [unclassified Aurantimonas]MEC5290999.1 hypothetical protein [Aurantimonas sp. C2-3-R2]MEC5323430.1 hypothetical protein [Aurantimonas sp. A3-2-R12]MEC5381328.1 hypothetical protein [Aurantimonas sp. C2-6-R+9]MEC5412150.1 hypothetical protein [Aurantimonas sp. C2-4-R8]HDZ75565.1 hypothetical protein [Aurantimonas coralicida]
MTMHSTPPRSDSRMVPRRRTRIQPVKIVSLDRTFLEDGTAIDRSSKGARIGRYAARRLPSQIALYDEVDCTFQPATLVWTRGLQIGLRFTGPVVAANRAEILRLTGRYYAITE